MTMFPPGMEPDDSEDSPDFSDEEVAAAVETLSHEDFLQKLADAFCAIATVPKGYELKRRARHKYIVARYSSDKALVFLADWL